MNQEILYTFSPFSFIQASKIRKTKEKQNSKIAKEKVTTVILITPLWQTSLWYPNLLAMSFSQPFLLPMSPGVLTNLKGEDHPFVRKKPLVLVAWKVTGKPWLSQACQKELPILSLTQRYKVYQLITTPLGKNGVVVL